MDLARAEPAPTTASLSEDARPLGFAPQDAVGFVASHAGGRCDRFDRPSDLSSCDSESEIFRVAGSLPHGLVDVIAAGHTHGGIAHHVYGIAVIQPFSRGQAFGRADVIFDRRTRSVARIQLFAPPEIVPAQYEGKAVASDPAIVQAMAPALQRVHDLQATPLGVSLDVPIRRVGELGSPLGNLIE